MILTIKLDLSKVKTMTKGRVILKALIAKRSLKDICETYKISYKFCHAVSEGEKKPSWDLMDKFRFLIPTDFWFENASNEFIEKCKENIKN